MTETTADRFGLAEQPRPRRASGLAGLARQQSAPPAALTLDSIPNAAAAIGPETELTDAERADLTLCETAARTSHTSYWLTGKALDTVNKRRLYRADYATFEDLLAAWDIPSSNAYRMMTGWPLAARLLQDVPKLAHAHVDALLPVVKAYGIEAAATLHALLRDSLDRVTADNIKSVVKELPLADTSGDPERLIRRHVEESLTEGGDDQEDQEDQGDSVRLREALQQRTRQLADDLKRRSIPQQQITRAFTEAFIDPDDTRVYKAFMQWMKARDKRDAQS
jgi:hypothetical protein